MLILKNNKRFLLEKGADVNAKDSSGVTPLDLAKNSNKGVKAVLGIEGNYFINLSLN